MLLPDQADAALEGALARLQRDFQGRGHVSLNVRRRPGDAERMQAFEALGAACGVPAVVTGAVLYHAPERRILQDVVTCIREGCTIDDAGFRRERNADRHLKTPAEMARLYARHPEALARTLEIVDRCTFSLSELRYQYPDEAELPGEAPQAALERLVWQAVPARYPASLPPAVDAQLRHELRLIADLEYAPYFLTVHSIVRFARGRGILCQGRGSAANSAVCFVLGITSIDPVRSGLLFERFVSAERREPPDIDVDFEAERREEVIQWVYEHYGRDRAALCCTVMRFRPRGAIRDVGKVLGLTEDVTGALASQVWGGGDDDAPRGGGGSGQGGSAKQDGGTPSPEGNAAGQTVGSRGPRRGVTEEHARALGLNLDDRRLRMALQLAEELVGFPRQLGTHPGGDGPWGLSWYHLTTMAFLFAFLLGATLIHFARTRRISGLVGRLTPGGAAAAPPGGKPGAAAVPGIPAAGSRTPVPQPSPDAATAPIAAPPKADGPKKPWSGALRVADIFRETPTVKTFRLRGLDGEDIPFSFLPGQFLTFSAQVDGKAIRRSYTIASSPAQRDYVEITVKREEQGAESRYLHDHVAIGDHLEVSGPSGVFIFTGREADSIVLVSGGVGITPMMCILRYLTDCGFPGEIFFLHGARTAQDIIFREELAYLKKRHANVRVVVTIGDYEDAAWTGLTGHVSKEMIAQSVPDIARRRVHVCGPPGMMAAVKATLLDLGVPGDKIKTEAFGPAKGAAPAPEPKNAVPAPDVDVPPAPAPAPPAGAAAPAPPASAAAPAPSAQVEVQFKKSGKTGPLAPDQSVLEAAEAIGVAIDFQCRVGTCGTCVVPLLQGAVTMEEESGLLPEDKARGIILACQAKSAAALVVDA